MEFLELAKQRWSVRKFADKAIEEDKLLRILQAGRVAPTACNYQPQKIFVAHSPESRAKLASVCRCTWNAPVILVVCYDLTRTWHSKLMPGYQSGETDASIVCTHMMLQAWEEGIGSCWVGYFNDEQVREVLSLPDNLRVSALLPIGYPAADAKPLPLHDEIRDFEDTIEFI